MSNFSALPNLLNNFYKLIYHFFGSKIDAALHLISKNIVQKYTQID